MLGPFQVLKPPITLRPKQTPRAGSDIVHPVAWWKFDEENGGCAANAVGTQLAGALQGTPRWAPGQGRHQGALELNGKGDWIECTGSSDLDIHDSLSISLWIKPKAASPGGDTLIAKGNAWELRRQGATGKLEFTVNGPQLAAPASRNSPTIESRQAPAANEWNHVLALYDGKQIALYLNGIQEDSIRASGSIAVNNLPLTLGDNAANRGDCWNGFMDDVRLFNRGLTVEEITALSSGL